MFKLSVLLVQVLTEKFIQNGYSGTLNEIILHDKTDTTTKVLDALP